MPQNSMTSPFDVAVFGPFHLLIASRQLLRHGVPLAMGGRALELLVALIEQHGEVVGKQELLTRAWPNLFVEEANLRVQMAALRRILGDGQDGQRYIANAARRGYSFVAPVDFVDLAEVVAGSPAPTVSARDNLPLAFTEVIGRETAIASLRTALRNHRLVTLAGAGGVGKTTAALEAARACLGDHDAVILVELAQISDPAHVAMAVATAIGITLGIGQWQISQPLPVERALIILDNCEHVVEAAAHVAEKLLLNAPGVRVLATSREPLRAQGEYVLRLSGLDVPGDIAADAASGYPAVRLFVERAAAALGSFEPTLDEIRAIVELCRRLDGIPLAIELAASRVDTFGLHGVADRLDNILRFLVSGRRTALKRHQTLQATLNWSYDHLTQGEQVTLSRLGIFAGPFSLEAAARVASFDEPSWETIDNLTNLVAKSLISTDFSQDVPRYRLLETTRSYALEKLRERDELGRLRRRHAHYLKEMMKIAEGEWARLPSGAWVSAYAGQLDNLRLALDWCFGPDGDPVLGAELTASSAVLWFQLSLVDEGRVLFERAIAALESKAQLDPAHQVALLCALGAALTYTVGPTAEARSPWDAAYRIARNLGNSELELRAMWGIWLFELSSGHYEAALEIAGRFMQLAAWQNGPSTQADIRTAHRLTGMSLLLLGRLGEARAALEAALSGIETGPSAVVRMQFDQELNARAFYSQTLWLLGHVEEASEMASQCVADARARGHATTLSLVLVESGCPIALYCGELDALEERVALLQDVSRRHPFGPWDAWGQCFRGSLHLARGDFAGAVAELSAGLEKLAGTGWPIRRAMFLCHLAQSLLGAGETRQAEIRIDQALDLAKASREGWILPELLRTKAEIVRDARPAEAFAGLDLARDMARANGMRFWQARCEATGREFGAHRRAV